MATKPQKGDFSASTSVCPLQAASDPTGDKIRSAGSMPPCSLTYSDPKPAQVDTAISSLSTTLPVSLYTAAQLGLPDYITHQHPHRPCSHYPSPPTLPPTNALLAVLKAEVYCHKSTPMLTPPGLIFEEDSDLKTSKSNRNFMQRTCKSYLKELNLAWLTLFTIPHVLSFRFHNISYSFLDCTTNPFASGLSLITQLFLFSLLSNIRKHYLPKVFLLPGNILLKLISLK